MSVHGHHWLPVRGLIADPGAVRETSSRAIRWRFGDRICVLDADANRAWVARGRETRPAPMGVGSGTIPLPTRTAIRRLFLHVAHDCNLACGYCYASGGLYGGTRRWMGWEEARRAVRWLADTAHDHVPEVVFFGGEPWLNVELIERVVREFRSLDYSVVTNGTLFDPRIARIAETGQMAALVSIDGPADVHDRSRRGPGGRGSYARIVENLRPMRAAYRQVAARLVYEPASSDLTGSLEHLLDLGFEQISFRPRWPGMGHVTEYTEREVEQLRQVARWYVAKLESRKELAVQPLHGLLRRLLTGKRIVDFCRFGSIVSVTPDGMAFPCTHFVASPDAALGSVHESRSLGAAIGRLQQRIRNSADACDHCWALAFCGRGCKAACFGLHGGFHGGDGFCAQRKLLVETFLRVIVDAESEGRDTPPIHDPVGRPGGDRWGGR